MAYPDNQIAASNVLRLATLEKVSLSFARAGVRCMALKGVAFLLSDESRMGTRPMTDVDLWAPFDALPEMEKILFPLGFRPRPDEPGEYEIPGDPWTRIDITERLWFLPPEETVSVWERAADLSGPLKRLEGHDLILHTIAHGAVHHDRWDKRGTQDLLACGAFLPQGIDGKTLIERARRWGLMNPLAWVAEHTEWGETLPPALRRSLQEQTAGMSFRLYEFFRERPASMTGHLLRLMLLPNWPSRFRHLWKSLIPNPHFQRRRYRLPLPLSYILRPFFLGIQLIKSVIHSCQGHRATT